MNEKKKKFLENNFQLSYILDNWASIFLSIHVVLQAKEYYTAKTCDTCESIVIDLYHVILELIVPQSICNLNNYLLITLFTKEYEFIFK